MTALTDRFDVTHEREGKFTYVTWSQVAERLDAVGEPWSFSIMAIGPDWVHGRLTIGDRHFENIGYAENASADWKKEALKDAASDAFKRCAALPGVARYLYDKPDEQPRAVAPPRPHPAPRSTTFIQKPHVADTSVPEEPDGFMDEFPSLGTDRVTCPIHNVPWLGETGDLWHKDPDGKYCRHPENVRKAARR